MKLRQKLAAVLAATMMVTAMPVVTMAASNAYAQKVVQQEKDKVFDAQLVIELKDDINLKADKTTAEIIYLELDGAEFDSAQVSEPTAGIEIKKTGDKEASVFINKAIGHENKIYLPIKAKLTGDEAKVKIVGGNVVSDQTVVIAKKIDADATVTAGDAKSLFDGGNVADITIDEPTVRALAKYDDQTKTYSYPTITVELDNSDFEFVIHEADKNTKEADLTKVDGSRGLAGIKASINYKKDDRTIVEINLNSFEPTGAGKLTIKNLGVITRTSVKTPALGDVDVTVKGDKVADKTVKVAEVKDFGSEFKVTKEEVITAGKDKEVEVTLKEVVEKETFLQGKRVEFNLDHGFFTRQLKDVDTDELTNLQYFDEDGNELTKKGSEDLTDKDGKIVKDKAVSIRALMGTKNEIKFKTTVGTNLDAKDDVILKAEGRAIEKAKDLKIATVKTPFEITSEKAVVKAGLKGQKAGKVTIKEVEKGQLADLTLKVDAKDTGIVFSDKPVVTGTNVQLDKAKENTTTAGQYEVKIPVRRSSKEAASVEVKDIPVNVTRMAPEGAWDLEIGVKDYYGTLKVKDFFQVGTPNIEDLASNGLKKGSTSFVINNTKYIVNGVEKTLDAAPYVSAAGRTMVPVRALADAFGVDAKDIMFSNGTIIIVAGNKTVTLTNGSNTANVNGAPMKMDEKVTIKNGRAYAPASQIGNLLGVEPTWDQATQTATFTNK